MTGEEIPQELIDILDARAGKRHSRNGVVVGALAEILTRQEQMQQPRGLPHVIRGKPVKKIKIYIDVADWWIGCYVGPNHLYFCPLPTLVVRVDRRPR